MPSSNRLRVAALVNLPLTPLSGGHAKGWEKLAYAAAKSNLPLDLTVYFSGQELTKELTPHVRIRYLPPLFSTAKLKFLPYIPDDTDLSPYHPKLAKELSSFDLIHTTDGFFAFARTAEKISQKKKIPLVTSIHTDTPAYARIFTRRTIETIFGKGKLGYFLTDILRFPARQEAKMNKRLRAHLSACSHVLATREEDLKLAAHSCGKEKTVFMRTAIDYDLFGPQLKNRQALEADYNIPQNRIICVFVGRLDEGKNIYTLIEAMKKQIAKGTPLHLIAAGIGPADKELKERLGPHVTLAGFINPNELGRVYASADFLALPSEVETRSLVVTEALVCGLPVLVAEKSDVAALYGNPKAIQKVSGGADGWAKALEEMASNTTLRNQMAQEALLYAKAEIPTWEYFLAHDFFPVWQKVFQEKR